MGLRALCALLPALLACGLPPAGGAVPVDGPSSERDALAGTWSGRYWSDRGRGQGHGTIRFDLSPGSDTARGQVEMTFAPALHLYGRDPEAGEPAPRPCTTLDIAVVRVRGDSVRGTLAPHWNPACDCRTVSVFEGRVGGDTIAGGFVTRLESGGEPLATGRWEVVRQR